MSSEKVQGELGPVQQNVDTTPATFSVSPNCVGPSG